MGWGAPRAPLALEVRVLGGLPERREGQGGGQMCREHCGVGNMVPTIFSPKSGHKAPNMPVRGYLCVPLHSLHKWKVFLLFPWMSSSMLTGRINLLSESCF